MKKQDIDSIIENPAFINHSDDFAERIISASMHVEQKIDISIAQWLKKIFSEFLLPKPAYTFASVLVLGLIVGSGVATSEASQDISLSTQNLFFYDGANL